MTTRTILVWDADPPSDLVAPLREVIATSMDGVASPELPAVKLNAFHGQRDPRRVFSRSHPDLVLLVMHRRALGEARSRLELAAQSAPKAPVIVIIEDGESRDAFKLLHTGAADFVIPPVNPDEILTRVLRLLFQPGPNTLSEPGPSAVRRGIERLLGRSPKFVEELNKLPPIAECDAGVLIHGETGTGKELFARAIHDLSPRANKAFVPINCGAIPTELAENELFGHERGAFTGAHAAQTGVIQQADGGTLFLDEAPALPLLVQAKLLRFLQEKEFRPLGAPTVRRADVRIVAATNIDLETAVARGTFRRDLYYRLNVLPLLLPPLRDRPEDIPLLARFFLARFDRRCQKPAREFVPEAIDKLLQYHWPGNVRELEHVIERAVVFSRGAEISPGDLELPLSAVAKPSANTSFREAKARTVSQFEKNYVAGLLAAHAGNISRSARAAGKNRRAFWELMRKHGIEPEQYRATPVEVG